MRTFRCFDCGHTWQLPHGEGGVGSALTCSECGSRNVHRAEEERGWRRRRRSRQLEVESKAGFGFAGRGRGQGGRRGRRYE